MSLNWKQTKISSTRETKNNPVFYDDFELTPEDIDQTELIDHMHSTQNNIGMSKIFGPEQVDDGIPCFSLGKWRWRGNNESWWFCYSKTSAKRKEHKNSEVGLIRKIPIHRKDYRHTWQSNKSLIRALEIYKTEEESSKSTIFTNLLVFNYSFKYILRKKNISLLLIGKIYSPGQISFA